MIILYTNADCLSNKLMELQTLAYIEKPEIIIVTEILPKHSILGKIQEHEWQINGYNHITSDLGEKTRGIIIYAKKTMSIDKVEISSNFKEFLFTKVTVIQPNGQEQKLYILAVYRSPNSTDRNNGDLNELIDLISNKHNVEKLIIAGDFNYGKIKFCE